MTSFLHRPSRYLFFTGKGGVGKTALACATALRLADAGKRLLLVSTDPASNLDDMLGVTLTHRPTPVPGAPTLWALNIDPDQAANAYRQRVIAPYQGVWSDAQLAELREQLAGACTVEIAAFDEFAELLAGDGDAVPFDHVLFDTAPTGHTLRLLSLPRAWTGFLGANTQGASCLGPHAGLQTQQGRFAAAMAALADAARTTVVLVTRPDRAAFREVERTAQELDALGIRNQQLAINAVFTAAPNPDAPDPVAAALEARGLAALDALPDRLRRLETLRVPLRPFNMVGLPALRALLDDAAAADLAAAAAAERAAAERAGAEHAGPVGLDHAPLAALIDQLAAPGHGLILVMGKGGVGKTTIAAAVAAELATRGFAVHLSTTDPAAHVAATLDGQVDRLTVSRIDPAVETQAYVDRVMATRGAKLDDAGKALLAEDLRSPCYEEVAVFTAFSRLVSQARSQFVVLDTAPTGHTLLLLDATGSYHRQVLGHDADAKQASGRFVTPLMRLRDPDYTRVLVVTLAETTPVLEAAHLQADLRRAHIEPFAWVINASLAATGTHDPCLAQRVAAEREQIHLVRRHHASRLTIVPWLPDEPIGPARLLALARARA